MLRCDQVHTRSSPTSGGFMPLPHACIILGMRAAVAGLERQQGSARRADQPLDQLDVGSSQIFVVAPECESQMCNMPGTAVRASGSLQLGASMFPDAPLLLPLLPLPLLLEARPPPMPPPAPPPSSPSLRSS